MKISAEDGAGKLYYAGLRCISATSADRNSALLIVSTTISAVKCREVKRYAVFDSCEGTKKKYCGVDNMDFSKALGLLKQGKVIRRASWSEQKRIVLRYGSDGVLPHIRIITKDGSVDGYTAPNCDILANDWEVFE